MSDIPGPWPDGGALADSYRGEEAARKVIRRRDFEFTEEFLLRVIAEPRSPMELYWAVLAIREVGSAASVPALKALLTYPKVDVQMCALYSIAGLVRRQETALYVDALTGTWYRQKHAPLWSLEVTADPAALEPVAAWCKKSRSRMRNGKMHWQDGFELALYFYRLAPSSPEAARLFEDVAGDVWRLFKSAGMQQWKGYDGFLRELERRA